jgi:hypothetical protein
MGQFALLHFGSFPEASFALDQIKVLISRGQIECLKNAKVVYSDPEFDFAKAWAVQGADALELSPMPAIYTLPVLAQNELQHFNPLALFPNKSSVRFYAK